MSQQKITDKVLSLLEYLDKETPKEGTPMFYILGSYAKEIRCRLDEISLEAFAEINKEDEISKLQTELKTLNQKL